MDFSMPRVSADSVSQGASSSRRLGTDEQEQAAFEAARNTGEGPSASRGPVQGHPEHLPPDLEHMAAQARHAQNIVETFSRLDPRNATDRQIIHTAAQSEYRSSLATETTLKHAYQADRAAERADYHGRSILTRTGSPTEASVRRAIEATQGTPNAVPMAKVLRADTDTSDSYMRNHFGYGRRMLNDQLNRLEASGRPDPAPRISDDRDPVPTYTPRPAQEDTANSATATRASPPPSYDE